MHRTTDWDDLRVFLVVSRQGTLSGAARELSVSHSTVFRRLNSLEAQLDVRLFDRLSGGYVPTTAGEALAEAVERAEAEILAGERRLTGQDLRLDGPLRITMPETLVGPLMTMLIAPFERRHPQVELELIVSNAFLNLTKRDADIALRPTNDPPEMLVGRRLCGIATAIYDHVDRPAELGEPEAQRWVLPDDSLAHLAAARWLRDLAPPAAIRSNSMNGILEASKAGMGSAALPCFMADTEPLLRRVEGPLADLETGLWALTHLDLRRTARVRAFLDMAASAAGELRDLMEGRNPTGGNKGT